MRKTQEMAKINTMQVAPDCRRWWPVGALLCTPLAPGPRTRSSRSPAPSRPGTEVVRIELARRWPPCPPASRAGATARGDRPARRRQRAGSQRGRDQPGQPALGQRGPGRRPHAPGAQPEAGRQLPRPAAGQGACWSCWSRAAPGSGAQRRPAGAFAPPQNRGPGPARHRLPPRCRWRRPRRREPGQHAGRCRHPPAGPEPGGRVPALVAARQPAPPARRHRLRHAGAERVHLPERRPRAHGRRAARRLGAQRLPERQPVRARGAADEGRPEQADPGPGFTRARSCR
jgi:hypothetical protein